MTTRPTVRTFFDEDTFTATYVVSDDAAGRCAIIDSVLDFDPKSGRTSTASADAVIAHVREAGFTVDWLLETHIHADHLTAAPYLKARLGGTVAIGAGISTVQKTFARIFNAEDGFATDGSQFDHVFADGDRFAIGGLEGRVLHTPGHTPACLSYVIGDAVFVGDTIFMPDYGSARCDFPGGDARVLYRSVRRLLDLPPETRMFVGHDYGPDGRPYAVETTVAEQRRANIHMRDGVTEDQFVEMRTARDKTLDMPRLILPSVQVNMRAGAFPPPEDNGVTYLKVPLNTL
ncbi:MBL fold metallo-hydrolase [Novispirillum sp. DQ9]|uniref:MBL fold metallo-hydrolase n=1 Tax=Novispirillum sp. DQ9 TaxID=3398612 RepID=UPI003C79F799